MPERGIDRVVDLGINYIRLPLNGARWPKWMREGRAPPKGHFGPDE